MLRTLATICVLLAMTWPQGSQGLNVSVITPPEDANGDPVGLVILPGALLEGEEYRKTAEAIQAAAASKQEVYVGLCGDFFEGIVNPLEIEDAIEDAIDDMVDAGLPEDAPIFVAGHNLGGILLEAFAPLIEEVKGILLWGATPNRMAFNELPVMSLSGEVDGQVRISRIVKKYREVKDIIDGNEVYDYPVIVLPGVNHGQFSNDKLPVTIDDDIESSISIEEARKSIATATSAFLAYQSMKDLAARANLQTLMSQTSKLLEPFITLMDEEKSRLGDVSPWVNTAQKMISTLEDDDAENVVFNNELLEPNEEFHESSPSLITFKGERTLMYVNTTAYVDLGIFAVPPPFGQETAFEIEAKMMRMEALKEEAEKAGLELNFGDAITCKDINMAAWERAVAKASKDAMKRYDERMVEVVFEDDIMLTSDPEWLLTELVFNRTEQVLTIQSPSLITGTEDVLGLNGVHYCKLLSPARALEYIYVDGLRKP